MAGKEIAIKTTWFGRAARNASGLNLSCAPARDSCATADEGGQLIPSARPRPRCLFSSSRIAQIFRPRQKNTVACAAVDHTRSKSPGGDTSARAPTPGNDRSLRNAVIKTESW